MGRAEPSPTGPGGIVYGRNDSAGTPIGTSQAGPADISDDIENRAADGQAAGRAKRRARLFSGDSTTVDARWRRIGASEPRPGRIGPDGTHHQDDPPGHKGSQDDPWTPPAQGDTLFGKLVWFAVSLALVAIGQAIGGTFGLILLAFALPGLVIGGVAVLGLTLGIAFIAGSLALLAWLLFG